MQNLDPQTLAQILALQNSQRGVDNGANVVWYDPRYTTDSPNGWMVDKQYGYDYAQGDGGENARNAAKDQTYIRKLRADTGGNLGDYWDTSGNYLGTYDALNGGGGEFNKAVALIAGGYFGGNALADAYGAAGAAGGAQGAAGLSGYDAAMADLAASGGITPSAMGGGAAAGGAAAGSAGSIGGGTSAGGGLLGSAGSMLGDAAKAVGSNGQLIGAGLGAVAGAIDGGDKTQSTSRDPWAPAQPFLKQQLDQGQALSTKYQNQPFSQAQQAAYGNVGGLLDAINGNAGGLLGLANANASGQNQFVRGQPRQLIGGSQMNLSGFTPGLLGYLGSK